MRRRGLLRRGAGIGTGTGLFGLGVLGSQSGPAAAAGDTGTDEYAPNGHLDLPGTKELVVSDDGTVAYVAVSDGYATVDLSDPADPALLAERRGIDPSAVPTRTTPTGTGGSGTATPTASPSPSPTESPHDEVLGMLYDVAVDGDTMVAVGPAHPNRRVPWGVLVVDVADPDDPVNVAYHGTDFPIHNCWLDGDHVYLTANHEAIRLVVMDVATGEAVGTWRLTDVDAQWADVPRRLRPLHDVTVRDGVAAVAHWDAGTWLLDVSDPSAPSVVGHVAEQSIEDLLAIIRERVAVESVTPPGNSHYARTNAAGDLLAVGRESWAVRPSGDDALEGGPSGIDLYDASDPSAVRHLATIPPPESPDPTGEGVWTTAHNFAFRGDTLYTSWYHGGVKRFDVSDPTNPRELTWWRHADRTRFWTAVPTGNGFFVASSMGDGPDGPPGVWTFPDRPGVGGVPLESSTLSPTDGDTGPGSGHGSPTATPTPTLTPSDRQTTTTSPGMGALAGVLGVGGAAAGAAWQRRRRRRDETSGADDE